MPESVARTEMRFGTRLVRVYPAGPSAPAVYCSDYLESGEKVIEECRRLGASAFSLVTVSNLSWDADLSPWPHGPVVSREDDFRGLAGDYLGFLLDDVIPYADSVTGGAPSARHIAGYSISGKKNASQMCLDAVSDQFSLPPIDLSHYDYPVPPGDSSPGWLSRISDTLKATPASFEHLRKIYSLR